MNGWKALGFNSYKEYILSDIWQERKWALIDKKGVCKICDTNKDLTVHHNSYDSVGNEKECDLMVICNKCHEDLHK